MKAKTCRNCKYASVDASDFPCSECHLTATGIRTRWLPEDSRENWEIVLVDEKRYTKDDNVSFEAKGGEIMTDAEKIELLQAKVRVLELEVRALETRHEPMPIITLPWPPYPEPMTITYSGSKTA